MFHKKEHTKKIHGVISKQLFSPQIKVNISFARILNEYENLKHMGTHNSLKSAIQIAHKKQFQDPSHHPFSTLNSTFIGSKIPPNIAFNEGISAKSNNIITNYDHFIIDQDGILLGTSISFNVATEFATNYSGNGYVYEIDFPKMCIYAPHVFPLGKLEYSTVYHEKEIASVGSISHENIYSVTEYKCVGHFVKNGVTMNPNYQASADYVIHITSSDISEHEKINEVYCSVNQIPSNMTGIDIETAHDIQILMKNESMLYDKKSIKNEKFIIDALPKNISKKDCEELIQHSFKFFNQLSNHLDHKKDEEKNIPLYQL